MPAAEPVEATGRLMLKQQVKTNGFICILDLALINGAYMAAITNTDNKTITKKLLIAK